MKLSAKVEYAFKAVVELALRYHDEAPVRVHAISRAQKIPQQFLVQLLLRLKDAHIVISTRGISGGYYLARPPSQISLADIVSAVDENSLDTAQGKAAGRAGEAERLLAGIWQGLNASARQKLEGITMDQVITRLKKEEPAYQI